MYMGFAAGSMLQPHYQHLNTYTTNCPALTDIIPFVVQDKCSCPYPMQASIAVCACMFVLASCSDVSMQHNRAQLVACNKLIALVPCTH